MEARQLLKLALALIGDVKARRVLSLGRPNTLRHSVFGRGLQTVKKRALLPGFRRRKIVRHGFSGARRRHMLGDISSVFCFSSTALTHRCTRGHYHARRHLSLPPWRPRSLLRSSTGTLSCDILLITSRLATKRHVDLGCIGLRRTRSRLHRPIGTRYRFVPRVC